ncbi:hypothetical protein AgCh_025271 [Apium graveolens]
MRRRREGDRVNIVETAVLMVTWGEGQIGEGKNLILADEAAATGEDVTSFATISPIYVSKLAQVAFRRDGESSMTSYGALKNGQATRAIGGAASGGREMTEYKEPWDYYTNYPVTPPLRRPYSRDPVISKEGIKISCSLLYLAMDEGIIDRTPITSKFIVQNVKKMMEIKAKCAPPQKAVYDRVGLLDKLINQAVI